MDQAKIDGFKALLLNFNGRIGPNTFLQGVIVIIAAALILNLLSGILPVLSLLFGLLGLALIYPLFCVYAKRFHDANMGAIWTLAVVGGIIVGGFILGAIFSPMMMGGDSLVIGPGGRVTYGAGYHLRMMLVSMISTIILHGGAAYIVSRLKGTEGENQYGPQPVDAASPNPLA